ncbi:golgi re-assembly stacking protein, putative [Plasmodium chabaudi adami]|uniref:Golgi re-assembly stacking protein, putative n=1 Tax=Plasmodium chabaudi adami TaxID=5826 RepID=A0A1C6XEH9_PLACE|nr:golgi re-assembly stacking protein, putative [Plasmodium chabaudi adami]
MGAGQTKENNGGYRIIKISKNGPASKCNLEIFFDYIVKIDDVILLDESINTYNNFIDKVKNYENKELILYVYNCRYAKMKEIKIVPKKWSGNGLLGININYERFNALYEGVRILKTFNNSSDFECNLMEHSDYIIGHENNIIRNKKELTEYLDDIINIKNQDDLCKSEMYIYNSNTEMIRKIKINLDEIAQNIEFLEDSIKAKHLQAIPICNKENLNNITEENNSKEICFPQNNGLEKHEHCNDEYSVEYDKEMMKSQKKDQFNYFNSGNVASLSTNSEYNNDNRIINFHKSEKISNEYVCSKDNNTENILLAQNTNEVSEIDDFCYTNQQTNISVSVKNDNKNSYDENSTIEIEKDEIKRCGIVNSEEEFNNASDSSECNDKRKNNYSEYVKNMKIYTDEMTEIYESMRRNNEILNNIKQMKILETPLDGYNELVGNK